MKGKQRKGCMHGSIIDMIFSSIQIIPSQSPELVFTARLRGTDSLVTIASSAFE